MAKAYSSTAPNKPTAAPVATRRSARSKSVEPTEPAKDDATPAKGRRGGKKGKAAAKVKTPELPVVDENEVEDAAAEDDVPQDDQDALLAAQLNAEEEPVQPSPSRRSVAASAISGTTAKTSFSMEELESMDHEMILPGLPHLYTASENVVRELLPASTATTPATWKDIRLAGTKVNKRYDRHLKSLMSYKEDFGSQEYIRPDIVLRKILNVSSIEEVMPAIWRPDNIIFKINLALMLKNLLIVCDPADWTMAATAAIENLDMAFPGGIAGGEFNLAALQFWLDLAAQITIRRLEAVIESDPNFTPHAEIDNVFFDDEGTFKHATSLGFEGADEQNLNEANRRITDLVDSLKKPFADNDGTGATAANGKLKSQFRWDAFVDHALSYFQSRSFELDARIEQAGGVSEIIKALDHECERREDERIAERFKAAKSSSTARRSFGGKNAMAALKQRQKQIAQQPAPVAPMTAPTMLEANPEILTQDFANDQENGPHNPYNTAQSIARSSLQAVESFQKLQNANARAARARLTDRQPGAVRIDNHMWGDEDSQTVQYEVPGDDANQLPYGSSPVRGKRTYQAYTNDEEDFDPTQDEGFQTDTRDLGGADLQRRREKSFGKAPARHPTAEPGSSAVAGPSNYHSSPARPSPAKRQRKNPGSEIPASMPPYAPTDGEAPSSERFKRAKIEAKQNRVLASQEKPQQLRRPWSDAEENALIQLIENHGEGGISYSGLKAIDNEFIATGEAQLVGRTAEDMRFKARNMKVTFLRARQGLPMNWEHVILGAKEKKQLADRGIDYQQERVRASRTRDFEGEAELMAQLEAASNAG